MPSIFYIAKVKAAMEKGHHSISTIPKPLGMSASIATEVGPWFNGTNPTPMRINTLTTPTSGVQGAAMRGENIVLLSGLSTSYVNDVNDEAVVFSPGDNFEVHPHYVTKANASKFVVSLLSQGAANALSFERLNQDLAALVPAAGQPAGGLDRYNFPGYDPTDPDTDPVLVYMPIVAKLPANHKVKTSDAITTLNLEMEEHEKGTETDAYLTSMKWLLEHNAGNSMHHLCAFFDHTTLQQNNGSPAANNLAATCDFTPFMVQHAVAPGTGSEVVQERIKQTIIAAIGLAGIEEVSNNGPAPIQQIVQTTTQTESQQNARNQKNQLQWRLALCGMNDHGTVVVPELSQAFQDAYAEKSPTHASTHLQRALQDYITSVCPSLLGQRGSTCSIDPDEIYPLFTRLVLGCDVATANFRTHPNHVTKEVSIFCFLKSIPKSVEYAEVVTGGQSAMHAVAMAPLNNTIPTSSNVLYIQGQCTKLDHALHAIANFEAFIKFVMADPATHKSYLGEYLAIVYDFLGSMVNRRKVEPITDGPDGNKYFITNFLLDVHVGIARIFEFAYNPDVRKTVSEGGNLVAEFDKMKSDVEIVISNMRYNIASGKFTEWESMPRVYGLLVPKSNGTKNPNNNNNNNNTKGGGGVEKTPPTKKPKKDTTDNGSGAKKTENAHTIHGVIKRKAGVTSMPEIPLSILGMNIFKANALTRLCRANVLEGVVCKNEKCPYAHFSAKNFHARVADVQHQKEFCDWVNNSDKFEWTSPRPLTPRGS